MGIYIRTYMIVGCLNMNKHRWNKKMQAQFLKKVSELLSEGYALNEAIRFMSFHVKEKYRQDIETCIQMLTKGNSLYTAFEKLGFHRDVLSYLFFAEKHGDIHFALKESSVMLEKQLLHLEKFIQVLRYPLFLIALLLIILFVIQAVVTPQFSYMYEAVDLNASFFLTFVMFTIQGIKTFFFILFSFLLLLFFYYWVSFRKKPPLEKQKLLMKIPIVSKGLRLFHSYYFSLQMSNLLKGGLSVFECFTLFQEQHFLHFYREEANLFIEKLKKGESLEIIFAESPFFEQELSSVVQHGQAVGQLSKELYMYSRFVLERMEQKIMRIISYIQPVVFLMIGVFVLIIYLSILLPMYQMMGQV